MLLSSLFLHGNSNVFFSYFEGIFQEVNLSWEILIFLSFVSTFPPISFDLFPLSFSYNSFFLFLPPFLPSFFFISFLSSFPPLIHCFFACTSPFNNLSFFLLATRTYPSTDLSTYLSHSNSCCTCLLPFPSFPTHLFFPTPLPSYTYLSDCVSLYNYLPTFIFSYFLHYFITAFTALLSFAKQLNTSVRSGL